MFNSKHIASIPRYHCALIAFSLFGLFGWFSSPAALADLLPVAGGPASASSGGSSTGYAYLGINPTKWDPGENTASIHGFTAPAGPMTPGGASWSVMPSGTTTNAIDPHSGAGEANFYAGNLLTGAGSGSELSIFSSALNVWAAASGFSNLGMRSDNGSPVDSLDPGVGNTLFGDIRIGAFSFPAPQNHELAHGAQPGTVGVFGLFSPSLGGDIHFNKSRSWIDVEADIAGGGDGLGGYDLFSVALHEFGHALGLGHSPDPESIMYHFIASGESKRILSLHDIAGIQSLYGLASGGINSVPEPSSFLCLGILASCIIFIKQRKMRGSRSTSV